MGAIKNHFHEQICSDTKVLFDKIEIKYANRATSVDIESVYEPVKHIFYYTLIISNLHKLQGYYITDFEPTIDLEAIARRIEDSISKTGNYLDMLNNEFTSTTN